MGSRELQYNSGTGGIIILDSYSLSTRAVHISTKPMKNKRTGQTSQRQKVQVLPHAVPLPYGGITGHFLDGPYKQHRPVGLHSYSPPGPQGCNPWLLRGPRQLEATQARLSRGMVEPEVIAAMEPRRTRERRRIMVLAEIVLVCVRVDRRVGGGRSLQRSEAEVARKIARINPRQKEAGYDEGICRTTKEGGIHVLLSKPQSSSP